MLKLICEELCGFVYRDGEYISVVDASTHECREHMETVLKYASSKGLITGFKRLDNLVDEICYSCDTKSGAYMVITLNKGSINVVTDENVDKVLAAITSDITGADYDNVAKKMLILHNLISVFVYDPKAVRNYCRADGLYVSMLPADEEMSVIYDIYHRLTIPSKVYAGKNVPTPKWSSVYSKLVNFSREIFG